MSITTSAKEDGCPGDHTSRLPVATENASDQRKEPRESITHHSPVLVLHLRLWSHPSLGAIQFLVGISMCWQFTIFSPSPLTPNPFSTLLHLLCDPVADLCGLPHQISQSFGFELGSANGKPQHKAWVFYSPISSHFSKALAVALSFLWPEHGWGSPSSILLTLAASVSSPLIKLSSDKPF